MGKKVDIGYDIRDLFTTSYAESKVNMYQKLVKELPDNIADIDEKLIYMNSYIDSMFEKLNSNQNSVQGELFNVFEDKLVIAESNVNEIIENLTAARGNLQGKLDVAKVKLKTWKQIAKEEDEKKEEYNSKTAKNNPDKWEGACNGR